MDMAESGDGGVLPVLSVDDCCLPTATSNGEGDGVLKQHVAERCSVSIKSRGSDGSTLIVKEHDGAAAASEICDPVTDTLQSTGDEILSRNSPIHFDQGLINGPRKSAKKTLSQLHEQLLKKASGHLTGGNVNGNAAVVSSIETSSSPVQPVVCSSAEPDRLSDSSDQQSECKSKNEDSSVSEFNNSSENNADSLSESLCGDQKLGVVVDGNSNQSAEVNRSSVTTASKTDSRSKSRKAAKPVKRGQEVEPLEVDMPDIEICCTCNPTVNCASCSFTCCSEQQLAAHETDCHGASTQSTRLPFICRLCKHMADNRFSFECHMAHHPGQHTVRYYLCPYCKFDTNDMMSIEVHISGSHSAESFRFEVVQESIEYLQNLIECPVCREMHRWRQGFLSHVVRAHDLKSLAEHLEADFAENARPDKLTVPQRLFGNLLPALAVSKDCVVCEPEAVDDEIATAAACGNKSRGNKRIDISSQSIDDGDDSDTESESGTWTNDAMEIELCGIQPAGASGLTIRFHCSQCDFNSDDYAVYQKHCRTHSTNSPSVSVIASEHKRSVLAPVREMSTQSALANKAALQDAGQVTAGGLVLSAGATNMLAAGPLGPRGIARTVYQCHLCPFECLKQVHYRRHLAIHERNECLVEGYGCGYCHFTHNRLNCVKFHLGKYHGDQPIKMSRIIEGAAIELSEVELFALRSRRSYGSDGGSSRSSAPTMVPLVNAMQTDVGKLFDSTLIGDRNSSSLGVSSKKQSTANDKTSAQSEHDILDAFEQQLPAQMIYTDPVKCPCCDFTNRVRINLIRHLKLHKDETDYVGDVTTVDVDSVGGLAGSLLAAAAGEVDANTNDSSSTISIASQPSQLLTGTAEKPLLRRILTEKPILLKNEEMGHQSNAGVDDDLSPGSLSKQQQHELPKTSFASSSSQQQQQDYSEFCSKLSHTDQYKCHRCSFTNRFPSKVKRHFYYRHAKVPPYRCGHCPFEAVERGKVARHSQLVHRSLPVVVLQQEVELAPDNGGSNSTGTDFQSESGLKSPEFVANQIFPEDLDLATAIVKSEPVDADSEDAPLIDYYPKVEIWNDESTVDQNSQGAVSQTGSAASEMKVDLLLPTRPSGSGSRMCRRKFCCGHCGVVSRWNRRDIILHVMHVHVKRRVYTCRHCSFGNSKSKALVRAHCVKFHPTRSVSVRDNTALLNCVVADEGTDGIVTMVFAPNNKPLYDDVSIAQYLAKYKLQTIDNGGGGGGGGAQGSPPDLVDSGVSSNNFAGVKLSFSAAKKSSSANEPNFKIAGLEKAPMGLDDQTLMAEALMLHAQQPGAGHRDEGRPWKCRQCGFVHSRIVRVKYHLLCRHLNLKPFSCPYCNLYLWKSQSVLSHVDKCHPGMERRAVATVDEKAAYLRRNIERVSSAHVQPRPYRSSAGAAGGSSSLSNAGEVSLTAPAPGRPNLFRCKLCGYQDPRNDKTKYHIIKQHLKLRQFSCPYCHVYLWGRQQVAKHVAEQHPGYEIRIQRTFHEYEQFLRNNICKIDATRGHAVESYRLPPPSRTEPHPAPELSPSGSVTDDQLKTINRLSTLVARLPCDLCSFVTDSELSLSAHRRSHRLFQCAHCRFRHVLVAKVQSHCLSAHPSKPVHYKQWTPTMKPSSSPHNNNNSSNNNSMIESGTNAVASSPEPPFQKFYPCDLCPAHFVSQPELDDHVVGAHAGVFRCSYCLLVMTSKDGMIKHQLDEHGCDVPAVDVVLPHRDAATDSPVHGKRSPVKRAAETSDLENMAGVGGKNAHLDVAAVSSDVNGFQSSNDANSARFKCRLCHYGCFKLTVMRHHVMSHLRYHPFICPYCSLLRSVKSFPIKKHVRLKHPGCEERVLFVQNDVLERKVKSSFYRVKAQQTVAIVPATPVAGDADNETDEDEVEVIDEEADDEPPMLVKEVASPVAAAAAAAPIVQPTMTNAQPIQLSQAGQHKVLYQCKLCGLRTHIRMDMRHHLMREIHYKPYKCAYCPYTEPCRWSMRKHFRTRHAGVDVALIDLRDPEQDRKIEQLVEECSIPLKDVTDRELLAWKPRVVSPQRGIVSRLTTFAAIRPSGHTARGSASSSSSSSLAAASSTDDVTSSKKVKSRLVTSELTGTSLRLHRCTQCSYTTSNVKLLRGHLVKHGPCRLQCAYCDYRGHYPSRIYKHIRRHHRGCGFRVVKVHDDVDVRHPTTSPTAVRKSAAQLLLPVAKPAAAAAAPSHDEPLKLHRRARPLPGTVYLDGVALDVSLTTDQLGRFQCNECGYHTTNREHYKMHVVIHRPPNWQCFYCDQKYPLVFRLRRHSHSRHPNLPIKWIDLLTGQVCVDSRQTDTVINGVTSQQQIVVISDQNSTTADVRKPLKNTARKSTTPRIKVALFRSQQHRMKALRQIGPGRRRDDDDGGEVSDCVESDDELLVIDDSDAAGSQSEMDVSSSDAESAPDVCFCCQLCTYRVQSTSPSAFGRHMAEAHAGQLPPVELVMAGESDDVESLTLCRCSLCPYESFTQPDFEEHILSEHGLKRPFVCGTCDGFASFSRAAVADHARSTHGGVGGEELAVSCSRPYVMLPAESVENNGDGRSSSHYYNFNARVVLANVLKLSVNKFDRVLSSYGVVMSDNSIL